MSRPKNSFWKLPWPKNSPFGFPKSQSDPKIKTKSNVGIEGNLENKICCTFRVDRQRTKEIGSKLLEGQPLLSMLQQECSIYEMRVHDKNSFSLCFTHNISPTIPNWANFGRGIECVHACFKDWWMRSNQSWTTPLTPPPTQVSTKLHFA